MTNEQASEQHGPSPSFTRRSVLITSALAGVTWVKFDRSKLQDNAESDLSDSIGPFLGARENGRQNLWARIGRQSVWGVVTHDPVEGVYFGSYPESADADSAHDYCLVFEGPILVPERRYSMELCRVVGGHRLRSNRAGESPGDFVGSPDASASSSERRFVTEVVVKRPEARFTLGIGSCANEKPGQLNPSWKALGERKPDGLLLLGDTPYIDSTELEIQRRRYREFYSNPELANLMQLTPTWATWDDHDFAGDGADGTAKGKENSRRAFLEYHALASYGEKDQGIYTRFQLGAADVFVLDTRWFSGTELSFADATKKTLLGKQQWEWLTRGLKESAAPFKLLACGMVWNGAVRPGKPDYWMAYPHERAALFDFLAREKIAGVVLVSGDIHRSRIYAFPPEDTGVSYPLHELVTSPLGDHPMAAANVPSPDLLFDCGEKHQFLLLDIEASRLTARFHTAEKGEVRTMELQTNDLFPHSAIASTPRNQDGSQPRTQLVMERAKLAQADILFLGDSITEGWEGEGASIWREKLLPLGAVNLGVGGERTENLIWRLDHGQVDGFAKNEKPPRVGVLLLGTNNFGYGAPSRPEEVVQGLRAIVARLQRKLPAMKILLVSIFPRSDGANVPPEWITRANEGLAKLADGERVTFLDLSKTFLGADGTIDPKLSLDRLHLNAAGYERWFAALQPEIARLLAR